MILRKIGGVRSLAVGILLCGCLVSGSAVAEDAPESAELSSPVEVVEEVAAPPFRDALGLGAADGASGGTVEALGLEVDATEARVIADRMEAQQQVSRLAPVLEVQLGDSFAGIWFDASTGVGHLAVDGPTGDALPAAAEDVTAGGLEVDSVDFSIGELRSAWAEIPAMVSQAGYAVVGSGLDVKGNRVVVEVEGDLDAAARDLAPLGSRVVVAPGSAMVEMAGRTDPFVGGVKTYQSGMMVHSPTTGTNCTGGFPARKGTETVVLTAGHCGPASDFTVGSGWTAPDHALGYSGAGDSAWSPPIPGQDVEMIHVTSPGWTVSPCIYIDGSTCIDLTRYGDPVQGSVNCQSGGVTDAVTCGIVESANWTSGSLVDGAKSRILPEYIGNCAQLGDSGAPVFEWGVPFFGTPVVANGIFAGTNGDCDNQVRYYSRWSRIKASLGLTAPLGIPDATPHVATASTYDADKIWLFHIANYQMSYTRHDTTKSGEPAWDKWRLLPGPQGGWKGNPSATRNADGRVEVFGIGTDGNLHSVYEWSTAPSWAATSYGKPSMPAGVSLMGNVAASVNGLGRLEVFVTATDGTVWRQWQNVAGGNWSGWHAFTSEQGSLKLYGGLATALDSAGKLTLIGIGHQSGYFGGQAYRISQVCSGCGWQSSFTALPASSVPLLWAGAGMIRHDSDGHLEYFAAGTDLQLKHAFQWGGSWAWGNLGHSTLGGVSAAPGKPVGGVSHEYVFAATGTVGGSDPQQAETQSYYTRYVQSSGWGPWCPTGNDLANPCP